LGLAVAYEQAEGKRIGKGQLRQVGRRRPGGGDVAALKRPAKDRVGMSLAGHEHMFARSNGDGRLRRACPFRPLVAFVGGCLTDAVVVYGIASSLSQDIGDFYATMAEAEATLSQIFADEPEFQEALWVERIELEFSLN